VCSRDEESEAKECLGEGYWATEFGASGGSREICGRSGIMIYKTISQMRRENVTNLINAKVLYKG
jgi:hypothetical protein